MEKYGYGKSMMEILKKSAREFAGLIFAPAVVILLIGLMFAQGLQSGTIAVYNKDAGFDMPGMGHVSIPDQLLNGLDSNVFKVIKVSSEAEAFKLVSEGSATIALSFPEGFTEDMMARMSDPTYPMTNKIRLKIDKSNPLVTVLTAANIASALLKNAQGLKPDSLPIPVDLSALLEGGAPNVGAFVMPGIFIFVLFLIAVNATAGISFMRRKENPALNGAGVNMAFITLFTVVIALQAALLFATGAWVFHVTIPGNLLLGSLSILLLIFSGTALGTLASSVIEKAEQLLPFTLFAVLSILFAGIILPLELLPGWLRWLCYLMPPYYSVQGFRGFTLYGKATGWEWLMLGILLAFGLAFTVASAAAAGRKPEENKVK